MDTAIDEYVIKPILNGHSFNYSERIWYSLPPRMGGLGIIIPSEISDIYYQNSRGLTTEIVTRIVNQHDQQTTTNVNEAQNKNKHNIRSEKNKREEEKLAYVKSTLNIQKTKLLEAITEKGASNWLTTMPIKEHGLRFSGIPSVSDMEFNYPDSLQNVSVE